MTRRGESCTLEKCYNIILKDVGEKYHVKRGQQVVLHAVSVGGHVRGTRMITPADGMKRFILHKNLLVEPILALRDTLRVSYLARGDGYLRLMSNRT